MEEVLPEKEINELDLFSRIDDETDSLSLIREILSVRFWSCAYYSGYSKKNLIRALGQNPRLEFLNVLSKVTKDPTALEQEIHAKEGWGTKVHFWRAGGLLDNELFITDYPWSKDGELKAILKETKPRMILLLGDAATQTEQAHYTWKRGEEYLLGQIKGLYENSVNTGERVRLLLD